MSTYASLPHTPTPAGCELLDIAADLMGHDVRITLNNETCHPTADQARAIAAALNTAADLTDKHAR